MSTGTSGAPSSNGSDGRDSRGRFAKGNSGGPGNPFARRSAAFRTAVIEAVGEEGLAQVVEAMVAKARGGDVGAASLLLSHVVGRPSEATDPDRLDEQELRVLKAAPSILDLAILPRRIPIESLRDQDV